MKLCEYCQEQEGKHTAATGILCCDVCWEEEGMKDWTVEKQAAQDAQFKETMELVQQAIKEIHAENGVTSGAVCIACRKMIDSDDEGNWFCDCHDERPKKEGA